MAHYVFKGEGPGLPISSGGGCRLQKKINIPAIIAGGVNGGLALEAAPNDGVALPSTGFANTDILEVFQVPKGTKVSRCGVFNIVGEGGVATIDIGVTSATQTEDGAKADGWLNDHDLQTAGVSGGTTDGTLSMGNDTVPGGEVYITDGSIDITFNTAATAVAVFTVWAEVEWIDIVE